MATESFDFAGLSTATNFDALFAKGTSIDDFRDKYIVVALEGAGGEDIPDGRGTFIRVFRLLARDDVKGYAYLQTRLEWQVTAAGVVAPPDGSEGDRGMYNRASSPTEVVESTTPPRETFFVVVLDTADYTRRLGQGAKAIDTQWKAEKMRDVSRAGMFSLTPVIDSVIYGDLDKLRTLRPGVIGETSDAFTGGTTIKPNIVALGGVPWHGLKVAIPVEDIYVGHTVRMNKTSDPTGLGAEQLPILSDVLAANWDPSATSLGYTTFSSGYTKVRAFLKKKETRAIMNKVFGLANYDPSADQAAAVVAYNDGKDAGLWDAPTDIFSRSDKIPIMLDVVAGVYGALPPTPVPGGPTKTPIEQQLDDVKRELSAATGKIAQLEREKADWKAILSALKVNRNQLSVINTPTRVDDFGLYLAAFATSETPFQSAGPVTAGPGVDVADLQKQIDALMVAVDAADQRAVQAEARLKEAVDKLSRAELRLKEVGLDASIGTLRTLYNALLTKPNKTPDELERMDELHRRIVSWANAQEPRPVTSTFTRAKMDFAKDWVRNAKPRVIDTDGVEVRFHREDYYQNPEVILILNKGQTIPQLFTAVGSTRPGALIDLRRDRSAQWEFMRDMPDKGFAVVKRGKSAPTMITWDLKARGIGNALSNKAAGIILFLDGNQLIGISVVL